jgi:hypothetical protein
MTKGKKPVDAATALVRLDEGHVVDVSSLHPKSLPGELVYAFGQAMGEVADKFNRIHKYVTWLRTQDIRLDTDPLMDQATELIARAYPDAGSDAVDSYARGLRSLLTCAELPERFSVTNGVSVPCYNFGDLVDVRLVLQQDRMVWFAGVVVDTRHKNQKLSYEVFRLGDPPKGNGKNRNPVWMSVHSLRPHIEGAIFGECEDWDVDKVRIEYAPAKRSLEIAEIADSSSVPGSNVVPSESAPAHSPLLSSHEAGSGAPGISSRPRRQAAAGSTPLGQPVSSLGSRASGIPTKRSRADAGSSASIRNQTSRVGQGSASANFIALECASACDLSLTERAIATLQSLAAGGELSEKEFQDWFAELDTRCTFLARLYGEVDYINMCEETLELLEQYEGRQIVSLRDMKSYHEHLRIHGWVISPRMWTAHEIIVFCVILVDPGLQFNSILQKDKGKSGEAFQNRAMACLDHRVQKVMYSRLKLYGFIDVGHLPDDVPAGVVLNSGGSYLQLGTWEYLHCARFITDPTVAPSIIIVQGAPEYTGANAVYVATTTRRPSGQPVYVSISPLEMHGPPPGKEDPKAWDGVPLQQSLPPTHELRSAVENAEGQWATERVLYFENEDITIQSITAYDTGMRTLVLGCKQLRQKKKGWEVISATAIVDFDWNKKESIMEALPKQRLPTVTIMDDGIPTKHRLSFGPKRFVNSIGKANTLNKPEVTRPQQFHKDGPTLYDDVQFESNGRIKTDARIKTVRQAPLPTPHQGRGTSALFSYFTRTFLGLKPATKSSRVCPSQGLRLHAPLGTAVIFFFDTDHQGWRCRRADERDESRGAVELTVHVRGHFYVYSKDLRYLPTADLEETFEFLACFAQGWRLDEATRMVMLDSLQTFVGESDAQKSPYIAFQDQKELNRHISSISRSAAAASTATATSKRARQ